MANHALQLPNFSFPGVTPATMFDSVVAMAEAADAGGWSDIWVMDHFWQLPPLGGPSQPIMEAYTLLGALAARTSRVGLGTLVTGVTYRNPALLAKIVTTLDVISKGRAWLGLGAAWYEEEHVGLGFDFGTMSSRFERFEEALEICTAMFKGEAPTHAGKHYVTEGAINLPAPVRPSGIPILTGGGGERKTLRLTAKYANAWNVPAAPDEIAHKREVLAGHCADIGRDPSEITVTVLTSLFLAATPEEQAMIDGMMAANPQFAAASISGSTDEIADKLGRYVDAGVQTVIANVPFASTPEHIQAADAALAAALA